MIIQKFRKKEKILRYQKIIINKEIHKDLKYN